MQHVRTLTQIASLCLVAACGAFSPSATKIDIAPPDATLTAPPPRLSSDPGRALSQADTEILWSRDRAAYGVCYAKHDGLVQWSEAVVDAISSPDRRIGDASGRGLVSP